MSRQTYIPWGSMIEKFRDYSSGVVVLKLESPPESPGSLLNKCRFPALSLVQIREVRGNHILR